MSLQPSESRLAVVDQVLCRFQFWRNVVVGGLVLCVPVAVGMAILFDLELSYSRPWVLLLLLPGLLVGAGLTAMIHWALDRIADRVGRALRSEPAPRRKNHP